MLNFIKIILHITVLYIFYFIGIWIQQLFHLIIPGSVIGMILLFILLVTNVIKASWIDAGANLIIDHLALLFIPITVGLINYFHIFTGKGFWLFIIALGSTMLVIGGSGFISQWLMQRKDLNHE